MATAFRQVRMAEVMAEFHDGPHATPPPAETGPVYLGIKNITESGSLDLSSVRHISPDDFPRWTKRVVPRSDDVVFTYEATLHRYALIPDGFSGCLGRRLALIRPRKDMIDPTFLHLAMLGPEWRQTIEDRIISGSTVDRIPLVDFPDFPLTLPPLPTQRRIAAVLSAFDEVIEINERRIELLEDLARSLYQEWFVRFRFPGHEEVELVDSELGPIPEGWEMCRLGEIADLKYGKSLTAKNRRQGSVPVVSSAGVIDSHDESLVEGPGIVIGRKGNAGAVYWVPRDFFPIDTTYYVVTDEPLMPMYWQMRQLEFVDSHAAVPGLSRDQALSLQVVRPDRRVAARFDLVSRTLVDAASALRETNRRLAATRDLLLPRLVTGRLDISDIDLGVLEPDVAA